MRRDLLLALGLAAVAACVSGRSSRALEKGLLDPNNEDTWFDGDISRAYEAMTGGETGRGRGLVVHPAFGVVAHVPVALLRRGLRLEPLPAVRLSLALATALWISLLFAVMRVMGCPRSDGAVLALMASSSAATLFWSGVPETYVLASLSLLAALLLVAVAEGRRLSDGWYVGTTALTFAVTVTNGIYGFLATLAHRPLRRTAAIAAVGLSIVAALVAMQVAASPTGRLFPRGRREARFLQVPGPERLREVSLAMTMHTMVMPSLGRLAQPRRDGSARLCLSVQKEPPGSAGGWGAVAVACWGLLLALGLWALATLETLRRLRLLLALGLGFELVLHAFYGLETFLAAFQFLPLLVTIVGLATLTRARTVVLALAVALTVAAAVNNTARFGDAVEFYGREGHPPRIPPPAAP
jgi:hypothetical protein